MKERALEKFRKVIDLDPGSQEAADSKRWVELLKEPLKIGVVNVAGSNSPNDHDIIAAEIGQALRDSRMYEILDINDLRPPATPNLSKDWNQFLERCFKKGIKIIILTEIDKRSSKIMLEQQPGCNVAMEHIVRISAKAYSVKKKEMKADIAINERLSTIREKSQKEVDSLNGQLLITGAEKLVMRLLENDIF